MIEVAGRKRLKMSRFKYNCSTVGCTWHSNLSTSMEAHMEANPTHTIEVARSNRKNLGPRRIR